MNIRRKRRKPTDAEIRSKKRLERLIKILSKNSNGDSFYFFIFRLPENCDQWIDRSLADFRFKMICRMENDPMKWSDGILEGFHEDEQGGDTDGVEGGVYMNEYGGRNNGTDSIVYQNGRNGSDDQNEEYPYQQNIDLEWRTTNVRNYLEKFRTGRLYVYSNGFPPNRRRSPIKTVVLQEKHFWELVGKFSVSNSDNVLFGKHPWSCWGAVIPEKGKAKSKRRPKAKPKNKTKIR